MHLERPRAQGLAPIVGKIPFLVSVRVDPNLLVPTLRSIVKKVTMQDQIGERKTTYAFLDVPGLMNPETAENLVVAADSGADGLHSSQPSFYSMI
ncbi:hypothetical protein N7476_004751 [Penicillium atrosanguineum]|uniref:Uncharacterized protein n=1 Tax=Penicillium atrosanguineum TaxID=1132637 RepID=A0A9W9Q076_9EURO|nr:hypothetical protein N7476_004751 [Penicillium atrosanguineum]